MAIEYLGSDGFNNGTFRTDNIHMSGFSINAATYNTGPYGISAAYGGYIRYDIPDAANNASVSLWMHPGSILGGWAISQSLRVEFELSTGQYVGVRWNETEKTLNAYVDGVSVATGSVAVGFCDWFQVQLYVIVDNAGYIGCKIGGQLALDYSGDTLPDGAAAEVDHLRVTAGNSAAQNVYFDDIVYGRGGFLGDCRSAWIKPSADTVVNEWTPSTAVDHYTTVDEVPSNITDYLYTDTDGIEEELELENWDGAGKTPVAVTAWARAYEDVATAESLQVGVDSDGVDDVTEYIMTDVYTYYSHFMDENPDGPAAWDNAAINALKLRLESVI